MWSAETLLEAGGSRLRGREGRTRWGSQDPRGTEDFPVLGRLFPAPDLDLQVALISHVPTVKSTRVWTQTADT